MPKVSRDSASKSEHHEGIVDERSEELGGYTAEFDTFLSDMDGAPFLKGAPDDQCQCPHWGYVFKGKLTMRFSDRDETYEAGDAFYTPPGHTPMLYEGSEILWFHPTDELAKTMEVMTKNMEAMSPEG
jgi:hypothetical protein